MSAIVSMKDIVKRFGKLTALDGVSLEVQKGEAVAIIGASGSGKSTLLRMINHLETVTSGDIAIEGEFIVKTEDGQTRYADEASLRRICGKTGMVFQHFNLFPHLTALENVTVAPIRIKKEPPDKAKARARELLRVVGMESREDAFPSQLSGGQKQRTAIARALALDPDIMLFDEPTSALDPEITGEVLSVIHELARRQMTMLIVTHEMAFARDVSSRVLFMDEGRIVEQGPPDKIFRDPDSARLRAFLSSIR